MMRMWLGSGGRLGGALGELLPKRLPWHLVVVKLHRSDAGALEAQPLNRRYDTDGIRDEVVDHAGLVAVDEDALDVVAHVDRSYAAQCREHVARARDRHRRADERDVRGQKLLDLAEILVSYCAQVRTSGRLEFSFHDCLHD